MGECQLCYYIINRRNWCWEQSIKCTWYDHIYVENEGKISEKIMVIISEFTVFDTMYDFVFQ